MDQPKDIFSCFCTNASRRVPAELFWCNWLKRKIHCSAGEFVLQAHMLCQPEQYSACSTKYIRNLYAAAKHHPAQRQKALLAWGEPNSGHLQVKLIHLSPNGPSMPRDGVRTGYNTKKKKNNNPNTQKKTMCKGWWYCNSAGHVPSARGLLICPRKVRFTIQNIQMGEYTWPKYGSCTTHSTQQLFGFFRFLGVNVERHGAFIKFIYQDQSRWTHSTTIQHPIRKPLGIRSTHGEKPQTIRKLFQQLCQKTAIFQNIYCHLHLDTQMWKMKNHVCKH